MKTISVNAHTYDRNHYGVPKYSNDEIWNQPGDMAPNGVSAYRWLRKTSPDVSQLSPLAAWLFDNCPTCVAGKQKHPQLQYRVRCFNGKTIAEQQKWSDNERAVWGTWGDRPAAIDDWLFPIIQPKQSDEEYWNVVAAQILAAGINRVVIGDAEWRA